MTTFGIFVCALGAWVLVAILLCWLFGLFASEGKG